MLSLADGDIKFSSLPVASATSFGISGDIAVVGTSAGKLLLSRVSLGPLQWPMISLQGTEITIADDDTAVDCILIEGTSIPRGGGGLFACLTHGNVVTILQFRSKKKSPHEIPIPAELARLSLPSIGDEELVYTNRTSAHAWCGPHMLLVGCFNGSVVRVSIRERECTCDIVLTEPSPVVQLGWDPASRLLVISTIARSCLVTSFFPESETVSAVQVGQKSRDEGFFGACFVQSSGRVYSARHNNRVFEADATSGTVFKTFRLPEGAPLGLLMPIDACSSSEAEGGSSATTTSPDDPNAEVLIWSEAPGFVAILALSANSTCRSVREMTDDAQLVCSVRYRNFLMCLLANGSLMSVQVGSSARKEDAPIEAASNATASAVAEVASPPPPPPQASETSPAVVTAPPRTEPAEAIVHEQPAAPAATTTTKTTRRVSIIKKVSVRKKVAKKDEEDATLSPVAADPQDDDAQDSKGSSPPKEAHLLAAPSAAAAAAPVIMAEQPVAALSSLPPPPAPSPSPDHSSPTEILPEAVTATAAAVEQQQQLPPARPEGFLRFEGELVKLYRSYSACTLDKRVQPMLLKEMVGLAETCRERMKDARLLSKDEAALSEYARSFFSSEAEDEFGWSSKIRTLMLAGVEWLPHVALPNASASPAETAILFLDVVVSLPAVELELKCEACERALEALSEYEEFFSVVHRFSFRCVMMENPSCLPQLDVPGTDNWQPDGPITSASEKCLMSGDPAVLALLANDAHPLCAAHYYFPYLIAVLPSKAVGFVIDRFPKLTVRYAHWAFSGHVQSQAVSALRKHGSKLNRPAPGDLADCCCDIVLGLLLQYRDAIVKQGKCFEKCVEVLLERRSTILSVDAQQQPAAASVAITKKLRRLEDTVIDLLRSSPLNLIAAFPQLRSTMDRLAFPQGTIELNAVGATIVEQVKNDRIDLLLPLFQLTGDAITESHWISLFTAAHQNNLMDKAMFLCLTVVNAPKRVRYLIRRAFPHLDEPQQADQQLRDVAKKLSVLIGP
jgi:hypothetical protein